MLKPYMCISQPVRYYVSCYCSVWSRRRAGMNSNIALANLIPWLLVITRSKSVHFSNIEGNSRTAVAIIDIWMLDFEQVRA
jgi:hypothetical protein